MADKPADLGATGEFPRGKLKDEDEGELKLAVGIDPHTNTVLVDFGKPVAWIGMDPDAAIEFANVVKKRAEEAKGS